MARARRRWSYLSCFVTVFSLPGPAVFGCLAKSPGERRFQMLDPPPLFSLGTGDVEDIERGAGKTEVVVDE